MKNHGAVQSFPVKSFLVKTHASSITVSAVLSSRSETDKRQSFFFNLMVLVGIGFILLTSLWCSFLYS